MEKTSRKLFVGGIPISLSQPDFRKYFEQFGGILDAQVMTERDSGRSRGFGFVTFTEDETVEKVLEMQHNIQGKPVEIKRAEPKKPDRQPRPIILPVPAYFSPSGYPYPLTYAPGGYGQAIAYDSTGQYMIAPMYAPQIIPMEDPSGTVVYDQYAYYDPAAIQVITTPSSPSPVSSSTVSPSSGNSGTSGRVARVSRRGQASSASTAATSSPAPTPNSSLSLVDRVRVVQNEVRKKQRGQTTPDSEAPPRAARKSTPLPSSPSSSTPAASNMPARRSVVTMNTAGNWRSRSPSGNSGSPSTTTTPSSTTSTSASTTTSPKEGGSLHKYFQ